MRKTRRQSNNCLCPCAQVGRERAGGGRVGRGGADSHAPIVRGGAEALLLGGIKPGRLGENLLIVPGPAGGIDDIELGAILAIGDPAAGGVRVRVTGVRNPCPDFARSAGRDDWVEIFSTQ